MLTAVLLAASVAADVETLLEAGFRGDLAGHREAAAAYERIKDPTPSERYAMALVHLRHMKHGDAVRLLSKFRGDKGDPLHWAAALRLQAERGDLGPLLEDLPQLAGLSERIEVSDGRTEAERFARLLGRLIAAAELAGAGDEGPRVWRETLRALPAPHQSAFDSGYDAVLKIADRRVAELRERRSKRLRREREAAEASIARAKSRIDDAAEQRENIAVTVEDLDEIAEDRDADFDTALDTVGALTDSLDNERRLVLETITALTADLQLTREFESDDPDGLNRFLQVVDPSTGRRLRRSEFIRRQLLLESAKLAEVEERRTRIEQTAEQLRRRFASERRAIELSKIRLAAMDDDRQRRIDDTLKRLAGLAAKAAAAEQPDQNVAVRHNFRMLVPWDFDVERSRLLEKGGTPPAEGG